MTLIPLPVTGYRNTPIIALTANAFAEDRQRCVDAGMDGHLGKPVIPTALAATLRQWLPNLVEHRDDAPLLDSELTRALAKIPGLCLVPAVRSSPQRLANYCALLNRFVTMHCQDMAHLRDRLTADDQSGALATAHKLEGIAGLVGARGIALLAHDIELRLRGGADESDIAELVDQCEAELARLLVAISALPASLAAMGAPDIAAP